MTLNSENTFKICIPDTQISLLQQKLALATFPDELDDSGWNYGVPLADIRRLVTHWREKYDWRKAEAALNAEMPQFTKEVAVEGFGSMEVHYVHKKSELEGAIPLLFVHGCKFLVDFPYESRLIERVGPGSFIEVRKILPLLVKPASPDLPSFHVVAISLPGFGFSEAPKKPGFAPAKHAEVNT